MMDHRFVGIIAAVFISAALASAQPVGDYGDAPDGTDAYPGVAGRFPTLYNSTSGLMGGHALTVGQEAIGVFVSAEKDANDPADPDGIKNLVDKDRDDIVYTIIAGGRGRFRFQAKIADSAPRGKRYINALVDFNRNGSWEGEWVVKNQEVDIPPGAVRWVETEWFDWKARAPAWARLVITRSPITAAVWQGEGEFEYGEVQDFITKIEPERREEPPPPPGNKTKGCGNNVREGAEQCDGTDDRACPKKCKPDCTCPGPGQDPPGTPPGEPGRPGPERGPCTTPVDYHAIIINGGDNPRRRAGMDAAYDMAWALFDQGYGDIEFLGPYWDGGTSDRSTLSGIKAAFERVASKVKCVDRVLVYIVGHGLGKGGSKYGQTWPTGGVILQGKKGNREILTPEKLDEFLSMMPACPNQDCRTPGKSCHVSVVMESCHSGNFLGPLSKQGRTVAVSCAANEVSFFGTDDDGNWHGGDYTKGYVKDLYSPGTADTNNDSIVSVSEAHESAKAKLSIAKGFGKTQTPGFYSNECECLPLSCVGKCGDGSIDEANEEECDYNATPTGCPTGETCDENCKCQSAMTPEEPVDQPPGGELPTICPIGRYTSEEDCHNDCEEPDTCRQDSSTNCWYCVNVPTCKERDMHDTESDCENACEAPDRCQYNEGYGCWYCQQVTITCGSGLYEKSDCDGRCNSGKGETCIKYNDYCYRCVCPDLYVNSMSGSVHRSASTHCSTGGEYGLEVCETECSLSGTAQFKIKNKGTSNAGASTARVDLMSGEDSLVDSETEPISALSAGQTSDTKTVDLAKYEKVVGKTCDGLDWWTSSYTMWVFADYGDSVKECDEDNNDVHAETSAQ